MKPSPVTPNPWLALRRFTQARIALGRAGVSLPTAPQLAFQLAHAKAQDAVHLALDVGALQAALTGLGQETLVLHSAALDRDAYLKRPDLGRRLDGPSRQMLLDRVGGAPVSAEADARQHDIAFVVADGLSALAAGRHAQALLERVLPALRAEGWSIAPWAIVEQARVAIADEVGELLSARLVVILIGERPGLSSPDSLGLYLSWMPRPHLTDADRNCISNVRPEGLPYEQAARKLLQLLRESRRLRLSGVALKDEDNAAGQITSSPSLMDDR
ncbi:MAG: ethanolamine ammonia-lyase subunit EutC [Rubrivivax sp.]|nr:MAG: ethanolamine ammonia-lyase subunit EutC [Rubrivivax sp.]